MTPASTKLTLVTGFWNPAGLGREANLRSADVYLRLFEDLHHTIPWPIVVWTDPGWIEAVAAIVARDAPAERRIVGRDFNQLPHAAERDALARLRPFDNHDPRKDTVDLSIVTWAKFDLVVDAIALPGPASARWGWIDFGVAHVADLGGVDWRAIADVAPERARLCLMRATAPREIEDLAEFYRGNRGKVAASFFTGSAEAMVDLRDRVHDELGRMRATGRRVLDEQILAALTARAPYAFDRWYADYAGVLCNYVGIRRDVPTILDGLVYCRERELWTMGTDVARRLVEAIAAQTVLLTPAQTARLLHEAFICAYHEDRALAERVARVLCSIYHHGKDEFRRTLDAWQPLVEQNVRFVGIDLARPPWTIQQLVAQPDFACWRACL